MVEAKVKGYKTSGSVRTNGHASSGGHHGTVPRFVRSPTKPNNASPFSRINRTQWNINDGMSGGEMPYQYQEYPKHVYPHADKPKHFVVVNSEEEERQVLGGEEIINEEHERHRLLTLASIKKVPVDKRWGPAKLTKAIEDAGFDPTLDPFK